QYNATASKMVEHVNALVGGFDQGAGFGFGLEFTASTGGELKGYELYARALGSTRLYRSGELGARVGTNKTRGEFWFNYTRRTQDNFFDIGSLIPRTPENKLPTQRARHKGLFTPSILRRLEG